MLSADRKLFGAMWQPLGFPPNLVASSLCQLCLMQELLELSQLLKPGS